MDDGLLQLVLHGLDGVTELLDDLLGQPPPVGLRDGEGEVLHVRNGAQVPDRVSVLKS